MVCFVRLNIWNTRILQNKDNMLMKCISKGKIFTTHKKKIITGFNNCNGTLGVKWLLLGYSLNLLWLVDKNSKYKPRNILKIINNFKKFCESTRKQNIKRHFNIFSISFDFLEKRKKTKNIIFYKNWSKGELSKIKEK